MKFLVLVLFLSITIGNLDAQDDKSSAKDPLIAIGFNYGFQLPSGDLKVDFGTGFQAGLSVDWMTANNWILGVNGSFFWGNTVKYDAISSLRTPSGGIPVPEGYLTEITPKERGQEFSLHIGKLIPLSTKFRGGLRLTLGGGYLRHKIRLQEDFQVNLPQLSGEYRKGYDQLKGGPALIGFAGYQLLSKNGLINFMAGVSFTQGFTKSQRSWDFNNNQPYTGNRSDQLTTFKVAWILPIYFESNPEQIFY